MDRILEKVFDEGIGSLTAEERESLGSINDKTLTSG
jgi:hypothetical protein